MAEEKETPKTVYTMEQVAEHNNRDSLWLVMRDKVYDVTEYIDKHPGGADKFLDNAGTDITTQFEESHTTKIPLFIAKNYEIGICEKSSAKPLKEKKRDSKKKSTGKSTKEKNRASATQDEKYSSEYTLTAPRCALLSKQFGQLATVAGSVIEAGNMLYAALFVALGPLAKLLFKSPQKVLAFRVISQVERFVHRAGEQEFLENELYNMAMRHLAYVSYEQMKEQMELFIQTIINVIKNALDEYWNDEAQSVWYEFFGYIGAHLLKNSKEFGGKVSLLRSSWQQVQSLGGASKNKGAKGEGASDRSGGFGEALFFNLGVMSPEIATLITRDRASISALFEDGFTMMVTFVSDPPVLNEELYVLAARHLNYGTEDHHFPVFGQAVMVTLRSLLPRTWNWDHEDAWGWLWNIASKFMIKTIASGHAHKQRLDDSMARMESADMDEFGAQFYAILFASSLEVQEYFYKPNSLIKFIVSKVLKTIVSLLHSPDETTHGIRALGMRHIKYAIPPDLFPLFGTSLTGTLPNFLEGFWDEDILEAWVDVFEFVKDCMTRAVVSGTNLVTKALVSNNVADCREALDGAPRCERILWLLEVDVSNIKVSPFNWALQDAKFEVATYMLDDILSIRADREAYYYGKDVLFRVHPDLVEILCRLAPGMLNNVFDGLMWYSRNIVDGRRRVNYYIRDVYGNPNEKNYEDSAATPLANLTQMRQSEIFTHPFVMALLNLKWAQFARSMYLSNQLLNLVTLLCFVFGWIALDRTSGTAFGFRCATLAFVVYTFTIMQIWNVVAEIRARHTVVVFWNIKMPVFFLKATNSARFLANIAVIVAFATDIKFFANDAAILEASSMAQGIASAFFFALLIESSQLSITLVKSQHRLRIVSTDFLIYMLCITFVIIGFSCAMVLAEGVGTEKSSDFTTVWSSVLNLYATALGIYSFQLTNFSGQMLVLYVLYTICTIYMFGRLLLGVMTTILISDYEKVDGFAFLERARLIIEIESSCKLSFRKKIWDSMDMEKAVEFDAGDLGPAGGMQVQEIVGRAMSKRAADDRIRRYPGECSPTKPWPRILDKAGKGIDQQLENLAGIGEKIRKTIVELQKKGTNTGGGGLPTLSEGDNSVDDQSEGY